MNVETDPLVNQFIESLEGHTIAKVFRMINLLEVFGYSLAFPHSKKIDKSLFELRIRGQQEVRIFYTFHSNSAYLLHGFVKKDQKIPRRELQTALGKLNLLT
jgi:phage-related protein